MGHLSQDQHRTEQRNSQRGIQPGDLLKVDLFPQIRNQQEKDQRYQHDHILPDGLSKDNLMADTITTFSEAYILFSKKLVNILVDQRYHRDRSKQKDQYKCKENKYRDISA